MLGHVRTTAVIIALGCSVELVLAAEPVFVDKTAELKLSLSDSAACWADFDNDGWTDVSSGGRIWRNEAGKSFSVWAEGVGSLVAADFDNDGLIDVFSYDSMRALRNAGGGPFEPLTLPELPRCVSLGAAAADFNNDGFCDVYIAGYEDWDNNITFPDMLLLNDEGKGFTLAWSEVRYRARGATACDFDEDGDVDVYVSNYRLQPNVLWMNNGKAAFTDEAEKYNALSTAPGFGGGHSIGSAWGDFDNDGRFDLFAGNFAHVDGRGDQPKSRFLRNTGDKDNPAFEDRGPCGVFYQESYATPAAGDFDNDGDLDLFFTTVYGTASFGVPNQPTLFRNDGTFQFADATAAAGVGGLGPTYQAAWADFDRDGDLDLVTNGKMFVNQGSPQTKHWLAVRLEGDGIAINRAAIGAQLRIKLPDRVIARQVEAGTGQGNQNDLTLHFGLGDAAASVELEITWPNGVKQAISAEIDRVLTVQYEPGS